MQSQITQLLEIHVVRQRRWPCGFSCSRGWHPQTIQDPLPKVLELFINHWMSKGRISLIGKADSNTWSHYVWKRAQMFGEPVVGRRNIFKKWKLTTASYIHSSITLNSQDMPSSSKNAHPACPASNRTNPSAIPWNHNTGVCNKSSYSGYSGF